MVSQSGIACGCYTPEILDVKTLVKLSISDILCSGEVSKKDVKYQL